MESPKTRKEIKNDLFFKLLPLLFKVAAQINLFLSTLLPSEN